MTTATQPRIYISGPMTGLPDLNFPAFNTAAEMLRSRGLNAINPAEINPDGAQSWEACMREDIKALCNCHAIAMLPGWQNSKGAHLELHIAHRLGMGVAFLNDAESVEALCSWRGKTA